jgi:hypothetical protein
MYSGDVERCPTTRINDGARPTSAYLRECAAAILKVASGYRFLQVGEHSLHKRHEPETVHRWVKPYLSDGLAGLIFKADSGRKPKFSPSGHHDGADNSRATAAPCTAAERVDVSSVVAGGTAPERRSLCRRQPASHLALATALAATLQAWTAGRSHTGYGLRPETGGCASRRAGSSTVV